MKYFLRAFKQFAYICILCSLVLLVLVLLHVVSPDINVMFDQGWVSVGKIALMFAAICAFYPLFGYKKTNVGAPGEYSELRDAVVECMEERGYTLESEAGETMTFRSRSAVNRFFRMGEDRITVSKSFEGFEVEGLSRDIIRIVYAIRYKLREKIDNNSQ